MSTQRGGGDYGWLHTRHTFSFGRYYDPEKIQFGALRVLNDDIVQGGGGFEAHGHDNMEIISIPLQGALIHRDSMGHSHIIRPNDVQVMSAGTGITHTEHNHDLHVPVSFLQLWILPEAQNLSPHYAQHTFDPKIWENKFQILVWPRKYSGKLKISQQAFIARMSLAIGKTASYTWQCPGHGVYVFVMEGKVRVAETLLGRRDGMGVTGTTQLCFDGIENSDVLLVEIPMHSR